MFWSTRLRIALEMAAIGAILLAAAVIRRADAGGVRCMWNSLELQLDRDDYADELRAKGPEGLSEALVLYDTAWRFKADLEKGAASAPNYASAEVIAEAAEVCDRAKQLVDRVAGQRDAWMSRLYWYTDLEQAKAAAAKSGKPILSLRMLGKLCDEYSCANSRFFRTALYANESVSQKLRDDFVLHWQSVRPVPRVTIDFGDGRKLERTVTGNSAHYVLDSHGRPLDVLPGLYSPQAFQAWLERSMTLASHYAAADETERGTVLQDYHAERRQALLRDLFADLQAAAPEYLNLQRVRAGVEFFDREPYEAVWRRIAEHRGGEVKLDESSVALIRTLHPTAVRAGAVALTKAIVEDPILRLVSRFEHSLALDTVRNEYQLHRKIHEWYATGDAPPDFDALNERVYAELFLTPSSDPWLGLAPPDAYTGLVGGGLSAP